VGDRPRASGQERIQITLGRAGGKARPRAARDPRHLLACTAALALGFWGLLSLFAD
jgi:hypothetical protein